MTTPEDAKPTDKPLTDIAFSSFDLQPALLEGLEAAGFSRCTPIQAMVVDGSKVVRKMIEGVLRQQLQSIDFVGCETGEEAKQALQSGAFSLVTTALRLPDMDGLALAKHLREHTPQAYIPIIVVSGDVQEQIGRAHV